VIDPKAAALLEADSSLIVGTVDATGMPDANRAWSVRVHDGGTRLRVVVADDATTLCENLRATGRFALTATNIITNESVQVKGDATPPGPETEEDRASRERHTDDFKDAVRRAENTADEYISKVIPRSFAAFDVTVHEVFDQTPGPAAGRQTAPLPAGKE
jgi:hypothetical protein